MTARTSGLRKWANFPLLLTVGFLLLYGAVIVHSATSGFGSGAAMFQRQLLGAGLGLVALCVMWVLDYRMYESWLGPLVVLNAFLIVSPLIPGLGVEAKGAQAWLEIAGVRLFQPAEPAKLITIVIMAIVISQYKGVIERPRDVARITAFLALPFGLILLQPDLGTGLVFIAITMGMLVVGGLKPKWFVLFAVIGVIAVAGVFRFGLLQQYQEDRLLVFIQPDRDPRGAGYNLEQSKIAIGSGGLTGKGLGQGTQSNLNFLPERHTDFIFSVLGEELGFVGTVLLLGLYLALLMVALEISTSSRDLYGSLVAVGLISMWTFQILQNMGMTMGLMPITGIPLPFISFGSSFMLTNLAGTGMLLSVWARRSGV
ncbi:MAG: rod shape-determining protein RodA [Anaerosomatales bacterium]|nr:rod shape-determining protein RodA [Anaerosomatales bacterium]MDT8433553.1 rod shape-determining protein RodA [Anaerosomatales bacterium]